MELDHVTHNPLLLTQTTKGAKQMRDPEEAANYSRLVLILDNKSADGRTDGSQRRFDGDK